MKIWIQIFYFVISLTTIFLFIKYGIRITKQNVQKNIRNPHSKVKMSIPSWSQPPLEDPSVALFAIWSGCSLIDTSLVFILYSNPYLFFTQTETEKTSPVISVKPLTISRIVQHDIRLECEDVILDDYSFT